MGASKVAESRASSTLGVALSFGLTSVSGSNNFSSEDFPANAFSAAIGHFFNINSGAYKSWLTEAASDMDGGGVVSLVAGSFLGQAAVTSLKFYCSSGSDLLDESRIDLFGVLPRMVA